MAERTRPPGPTHYDEKQVAELLRRAAALDQKRKLEQPALSLAEVEAIAKEAGLDPALVRRAAGELASQGETGGWAGAPLTKTIERVIDGELLPEDHEALGTAIREALGGGGFPVQIATLGRSLSVTTFNKSGVIDIQISPKEGTTVIRITVNSRQLAGGLFGGLIGGIGGGLGSNVAWLAPFLMYRAGLPIVDGIVAGAAGLLAVCGGSYWLARGLYVSMARSLHTRVEQLAETLESSLRTAISRRAGVAPVSNP